MSDAGRLQAELGRAREALRALVYFYRHGYSQQAVWEFAKYDPTHPAWLAYMDGGTSAVARWSYEVAERALNEKTS